MKKIVILFLIGILLLTGCEKKKTENIELKEYSFIGMSWTRDSGHDEETIKFNEDGSFSYSCACGNPVNDADLCETYTYDDKTKEIKLDCFETTEDTITTIKVIKSNDSTLELDFNGEIRTFEKESN